MRLGWIATVAAALTVMLGAVAAHADDGGGPVPFAAGDHASARLPESPVRGREVSADRPPGSVPPGARTVPSWSGSFTTDGVPYPYTMVGTDPARGAATTVVPVVLIPLRVRFASDHETLDDPQMVADVTSSPLFVPMPFVTGVTQYPDAFQRANLWSQVDPGYHLLLGGPRVLKTVTIDVPRRQGVTDFNTTTNRRIGIVGSAWLDRKLTSLLEELGIRPGTLPVFLTYNVAGTNGDPAACLQPSGCEYFWGYHGAVAHDSAPRGPDVHLLDVHRLGRRDPAADRRARIRAQPRAHRVDRRPVRPASAHGRAGDADLQPGAALDVGVLSRVQRRPRSRRPARGQRRQRDAARRGRAPARRRRLPVVVRAPEPVDLDPGLYDALGVFDGYSSAC